MRKVKFVEGEFYHIFNRGVDKRIIFQDQDDLKRFFQSMKEFNVEEPIGSIYENSFNKSKNQLENLVSKQEQKLVNFICYCLNPNHYHFILEPLVENGVEKFMQRIGGYSRYFNLKYKRNGALFQGRFKAVHISSNEQLLHTSVYVNLNDNIHALGSRVPKLSSWNEYTRNINSIFCKKDIILDQFDNKEEYKKFAEESLKDILSRRNESNDENIESKELFLE
ncbi:MAG: transposase [Parcubacteria group bacterium]|nr:transposase [Parcubacteria group bacterium]